MDSHSGRNSVWNGHAEQPYNLPEDPVELRQVTELLAAEVKAQALMVEKL